MYSWLVKNLTFPFYEKLKKLNITKYLRELEDTQWYSSEKLKEIQWEKLKELIKHCYKNVPYYNYLFNSISLKPNDIKNIEDLDKIPILTKNKLQENLNLLIAKDKDRSFYIHSSSGSTGIPHTVYVDKRAESYRLASLFRARRWWGWDLGNKTILLGGGFESKQSLREVIRAHICENRKTLYAFNITKESFKKYYLTMKRFRPEYLYGFASAFYALAQLFDENGFDASELRIHGIITMSEILYEYQRKFIESTFNCPVINQYGCSETGVISFQCPEGSMHLTNENHIIEFISNQRSALPGELGDIIITDLNNYVMPLIRYKLGDFGSFNQKRCSCGRGLPAMEINIGREFDLVVLKNGKLVLPMIFNFIGIHLIEECKGKIKQFRVIQKAEDSFLLQIVAELGFEPTAKEFFTNAFKDKLGDYGKLDFNFVDEIPKESSGKVRYFISEIPKEKYNTLIRKYQESKEK